MGLQVSTSTSWMSRCSGTPSSPSTRFDRMDSPVTSDGLCLVYIPGTKQDSCSSQNGPSVVSGLSTQDLFPAKISEGFVSGVYFLSDLWFLFTGEVACRSAKHSAMLQSTPGGRPTRQAAMLQQLIKSSCAPLDSALIEPRRFLDGRAVIQIVGMTSKKLSSFSHLIFDAMTWMRHHGGQERRQHERGEKHVPYGPSGKCLMKSISER